MRTKIFVVAILSVILVGFSACKLAGESNYTPRISLISPAYINTDSLLDMKRSEDGNIKFDSLHVNDTVTVVVVADAFVNYLTKFEYSVDRSDVVEILVVDSVKKSFDDSSDYVQGKIVMFENVFGMRYPFKFVATKPADKVKINFEVESTAVDVPNKSSLSLEFPIKP